MKEARNIIVQTPFPSIDISNRKALEKFLSTPAIHFLLDVSISHNAEPTLKNIYELRNLNPAAAMELILLFMRAGVIDSSLTTARDNAGIAMARMCFGEQNDDLDDIANRLVAEYQNNADDLMRVPLPPHEALFMANAIALWELRPWLLGENPCAVSVEVFVRNGGWPENFKDYMLKITTPTPVYVDGKLASLGETEDLLNNVERLFRYNRHLQAELYELVDRLGFCGQCDDVEEWDILSILEVLMRCLRKADAEGFDIAKMINTAVIAIYA